MKPDHPVVECPYRILVPTSFRRSKWPLMVRWPSKTNLLLRRLLPVYLEVRTKVRHPPVLARGRVLVRVLVRIIEGKVIIRRNVISEMGKATIKEKSELRKVIADRITEIQIAEIRITEIQIAEIWITQIQIAEIRIAEIQIAEIHIAEIQIAKIQIAKIQIEEIAVIGKADEKEMIEMTAILVEAGTGAIRGIALSVTTIGTTTGTTTGTMTGTMIAVGAGITHRTL